MLSFLGFDLNQATKKAVQLIRLGEDPKKVRSNAFKEWVQQSIQKIAKAAHLKLASESFGPLVEMVKQYLDLSESIRLEMEQDLQYFSKWGDAMVEKHQTSTPTDYFDLK